MLFQMHVVVDGSDDIFLRNVLRNQVMDISSDSSLSSSSSSPAFFPGLEQAQDNILIQKRQLLPDRKDT